MSPRLSLAAASMLMAMLAIAGCRGPATTAAATASPTGASAPAAALPPLPWPKVPCRRNVEAFLAVGGMRLADLADVQVREDRLAGSQPGEAVSHWHVSGRPPSCGTGRLDLVVLPDCGIDEWATSGGCRLPAYEPSS